MDSLPQSPTAGHSVGFESSLVDLSESPPKASEDSIGGRFETSSPTNNWDKLSIIELQTLLRCFGLSTEGYKDDLVERLELRTVNGDVTKSTVISNSEDTPAPASPASMTPLMGLDTGILLGNLSMRPDLAIFDVETTIPRFKGGAVALLEFGVIVVDSRTLVEDPRLKFSTLVKPPNLKYISKRSIACNSITAEMVSEAPVFAEVANRIHRALDGRIWVGHNINAFDVKVINEQFEAIGQKAPRPAGTIDTLALFRKHFGKRAGDLKMASLGRYFGQGIEQHRALADAQMTLNVLRNAGALLFLEHSAPDAMWSTTGESNGHVAHENEVGIRGASVPHSKKQTSSTSSKEITTQNTKKVTRMPIPTKMCAEPMVQSTAHGEYVHFNGIEAFLKHHVGRKKGCDTSPSAVSALAKKKRGVLTSWVKKQDHESAPVEKSSTPFTLCQQIADLNLQSDKEKIVSGKESNAENLTENQRLRIEANRLRALELRSKKHGSKSGSSASSSSSGGSDSINGGTSSGNTHRNSSNSDNSTSSSTSSSGCSSGESSSSSGGDNSHGSTRIGTGSRSSGSRRSAPQSTPPTGLDNSRELGRKQCVSGNFCSDIEGASEIAQPSSIDGGLEVSTNRTKRAEAVQAQWTDD